MIVHGLETGVVEGMLAARSCNQITRSHVIQADGTFGVLELDSLPFNQSATRSLLENAFHGNAAMGGVAIELFLHNLGIPYSKRLKHLDNANKD